MSTSAVSSNNVGFPIDVIIFPKDGKEIKIKRFKEQDLYTISELWREKLNKAVSEVPDDWMKLYP